MAMTALRKVAPSWYTPEGERGSDDPTRFKLRPMTPPELESVFEQTSAGIGVPPKNYAMVLKSGITDYDSFMDENGKPLKCSPVNHSRIPSEVRFELAVEILNMSQLDEDESGNSE